MHGGPKEQRSGIALRIKPRGLPSPLFFLARTLVWGEASDLPILGLVSALIAAVVKARQKLAIRMVSAGAENVICFIMDAPEEAEAAFCKLSQFKVLFGCM